MAAISPILNIYTTTKFSLKRTVHHAERRAERIIRFGPQTRKLRAFKPGRRKFKDGAHCDVTILEAVKYNMSHPDGKTERIIKIGRKTPEIQAFELKVGKLNHGDCYNGRHALVFRSWLQVLVSPVFLVRFV